MKKSLVFITVWVGVISVVLIYGQYGKSLMKNCGLSDIHNETDIWKYKIHLSTIMGVDDFYKETEMDSVVDHYLDADYSMVVKATGNLKLYHGSMNQEVEIKKVIDNHTFTECTEADNVASKGEKVWINSYFGIDFIFPLEENQSTQDIYYNDLCVMPMEKNDTYLVFVDEDDLNHIYKKKVYHIKDSILLEYFNLSSNKSFVVSKKIKDLELKDFRESEFIASSDIVLKRMLKFKQRMISELQSKGCL